MTHRNTHTIGLDAGDETSTVCVLDAEGQVVETAWLATSASSMERYFQGWAPARVVLELGTHSPWLSRKLDELGLEVVVANTRRMKLIADNPCTGGEVDAERLARLGRDDPKLLALIQHRKEDIQADLAMLRARDALVRARASLINAVRGQVKSRGGRVQPCSADSFSTKALADLPTALHPALAPLLEVIEKHTLEIRTYDKKVAELCETRYPEAQRLMEIQGVGPLTALSFGLTLEEDPSRYKNGRMVGTYIGLVPRRPPSGDKNPMLGITKAGDPYLRKLLVQCAHYILGPCGQDSALRRWGSSLVERGGHGAKELAAIALARKLSCVMYGLWVTGGSYRPFPTRSRRSREREERAA